MHPRTAYFHPGVTGCDDFDGVPIPEPLPLPAEGEGLTQADLEPTLKDWS